MPGRQQYLEDVVDRIAGRNIIVGGPDVLPDSSALRSRVYPVLRHAATMGDTFNSMQYDSYSHKRAGSEELWTLQELFEYARDDLQVEYLFWNRKIWMKPAGSYRFHDATRVISNNKDFSAP